jgi:hypothetical protein
VNQPSGTDRDLTADLAVVCEQDRGGSPFGWDDVPHLLAADVVEVLHTAGYLDAHATEHTIVVPLTGAATGLPGAHDRGEHLYAVWGDARPEWSWCTAHPNAPTAGAMAPLLVSPHDDPQNLAAQILRVLRTGRTLP